MKITVHGPSEEGLKRAAFMFYDMLLRKYREDEEFRKEVDEFAKQKKEQKEEQE